ncbi:Nn.00g107530.m01.CDS01 [Neocucurbitaria sp. VM-36]
MLLSTSHVSTRRKKRWASPEGNGNAAHTPLHSMSPEPVLQETRDVSNDYIVAHTQPCGEPSRNPKRPGLLDLPFELLSDIATYLCGSNDIINLARVNKHVHRVAREALLKNLVVPRNHIKQFLEFLVHNPELIEKINTVDLGDFGCGKAIAANTKNTVEWNEISHEEINSGSVLCDNNTYFVDILLSMCPNIRSLTVELPEEKTFDSGQAPPHANLVYPDLPTHNLEMWPSPPLLGPALRVMLKTLEVLTITEGSRWKGPEKLEVLTNQQDLMWRNMGKGTLSLLGFEKLRRLDVPMYLLGRPKTLVFWDPSMAFVMSLKAEVGKLGEDHNNANMQAMRLFTKVIPLSLRRLLVRSCNRHTFALLQKINRVPLEKLKLKQIDLYFKTSPGPSLVQCYANDDGELNYPSVLTDLAEKGVKVTFYTGPNEKSFDMCKDLAALSCLSPLEAWHFAASGKKFSHLNMNASTKRRSSIIAHQLFMKHAHLYFRLMNRPTFDGQRWKEVAFFHGSRNTKFVINIPPTSKAHILNSDSWVERPLGKAEFMRRLQILPDLCDFEFDFRSEIKLILPPTEVQFLGATMVIPRKPLPVFKKITKASKKSVIAAEDSDSDSDPRKGHRVDKRTKKTEKKKPAKSLESHLAKLRLEDKVVDKFSYDRVVRYDQMSKFDRGLWSGFNWKFFLKPGKRTKSRWDMS